MISQPDIGERVACIEAIKNATAVATRFQAGMYVDLVL